MDGPCVHGEFCPIVFLFCVGLTLFPEQTHSQEVRVGFSSCVTDAAMDALTTLLKENDARRLEQNHWDDFRRKNEADVQLLHFVCDRSRVLEREYAALQCRIRSKRRKGQTATAQRSQRVRASHRPSSWQRSESSGRKRAQRRSRRYRRRGIRRRSRAVRLEEEHVMLWTDAAGASCESAYWTVRCCQTATDGRGVVCVVLGARGQAKRLGRGARGETHGSATKYMNYSIRKPLHR